MLVHRPRRWIPRAAVPICAILCLCVAAGAMPVGAQEAGDTGGAIRLMVGDAGLAIGHVPRVKGLRINGSDRSLERIDGVNLTLWRAEGSVGGRVHGLAIGSAPQAGTIRGIGAGAVVVGEERLEGIHLGAGAVVGGSAVRGLSLAGLAAVGGDDVAGWQGAGLATIAGDRTAGVQTAGLAAIAGDRMSGIQAAGLASIAGGAGRGVQVGGLAAIAGGQLQGIQVGGLAAVTGDVARGLQLGGLAAVTGHVGRGLRFGGLGVVAGCALDGAQASLGIVEVGRPRSGEGAQRGGSGAQAEGCPGSLRGVTVAGLRARAASSRGLTAAGWIDVDDVRGLSVSMYQRSELKVGLAIGLVNWTDELRGLQLGLLNRAGNNRPPFGILPLVNAHF